MTKQHRGGDMDIEARMAKAQTEIENLKATQAEMRLSIERGFSEQRAAFEHAIGELRATIERGFSEQRAAFERALSEERLAWKRGLRWSIGISLTTLALVISLLTRSL
jgi:hypothetical protein